MTLDLWNLKKTKTKRRSQQTEISLLLCRTRRKPEDNELKPSMKWKVFVMIDATRTGQRQLKSFKRRKKRNQQTQNKTCERIKKKAWSKQYRVMRWESFFPRQMWGHVCSLLLSPFAGEYLSPHGKCHLCDATCMQCTGPEREDCTSCPKSWWEPLPCKHFYSKDAK